MSAIPGEMALSMMPCVPLNMKVGEIVLLISCFQGQKTPGRFIQFGYLKLDGQPTILFSGFLTSLATSGPRHAESQIEGARAAKHLRGQIPHRLNCPADQTMADFSNETEMSNLSLKDLQ